MTTSRRRTDSSSVEAPLIQNSSNVIVNIPLLRVLSNPPPIPNIVTNFLFAANSYLHKKTGDLRPSLQSRSLEHFEKLENLDSKEMEKKPSFASVANRSAFRDKTKEFKKIIQSARQRNMYQVVKKKPQPLQQYSQFMSVARDIQQDVRMSYDTLEKLTQLVKTKSFFDNKTSKIDMLTVQMKGDIDAIKRKVKDLKGLKCLITSRSEQEELLARNIVLSLESSLGDMTTEFRTLLEKRVENVKFQNDRRKELGENRGGSRPSFHSASSSEIAIDIDAALPDRYIQAQVQEFDQTGKYLSSRVEAMKTIETTIVELDQLNQQLVTMIQEQQEVIQRIDAHVEDTAVNVEAGHLELLKYFKSASSNQWLMVKMFLAIVFFIVLFVIFL